MRRMQPRLTKNNSGELKENTGMDRTRKPGTSSHNNMKPAEPEPVQRLTVFNHFVNVGVLFMDLRVLLRLLILWSCFGNKKSKKRRNYAPHSTYLRGSVFGIRLIWLNPGCLLCWKSWTAWKSTWIYHLLEILEFYQNFARSPRRFMVLWRLLIWCSDGCWCNFFRDITAAARCHGKNRIDCVDFVKICT